MKGAESYEDIIHLYSKLQKIEQYAFYQTKITSIAIPSSVTTLEPFAFQSCSNTTTITITETVTKKSGIMEEKTFKIPDLSTECGKLCGNGCRIGVQKLWSLSGAAFINNN